MPEIHQLTAVQLADAIYAGQVSAREVTEHTLDRAGDDAFGGFVHVAAERALQQADQADALRARLAAEGASRQEYPPLLGVPVPIKDLTAVAGVPMQAGSALMAGYVPERSDGVVTLLEEAGTIMVGKTATPEMGLPPYTETAIGPPAATPWDSARTAGGSSGGAGAVVAAGIVPMAHGSDGGGSIRIPAAACGLVGLKPSRGVISPGPHGLPGPGFGTDGVLTRTVADTALALNVLAKPWPGDAPACRVSDFTADLLTPLAPLRIGLVLEPYITPEVPPAPEAVAAAQKAARALEDLGHHVAPAPRPYPAEQWRPFLNVWSVMAASVPLPTEEGLMPLTRWMREVGRGVSGVDYAAAVNNGHALRRSASLAWVDFDVILSPTLATAPALHGEIRNDADPARDFWAQCEFTPWTSTWNIFGAPAISVPVHQADGLPYGAMLGGRIGDDHLLLRLAAQLEAAGIFEQLPIQ